MKLFAGLSFALCALSFAHGQQIVGARNLALDPTGSRIAFSYLGDIWVGPSTGGYAVPITSHVEMDDFPVWSPDGKTVAFASNRFGSYDIFSVDSNGGRPTRVTFNSSLERPTCWTPDGRSVLVSRQLDEPYQTAYSVNVQTGAFQKLLSDAPSLRTPQITQDGNYVLYGRLGFPWQRPRYQGSAAQDIWKYEVATGKRIKVRSTGYQHLWLQTAQNSIYAVTMTEPVGSSSTLTKSAGKIQWTVGGTPNVYRISLDGQATRLTNYVGDGTRFLTVSRDGKTIGFERDGDIIVMRDGKNPEKISLTANQDDKITTVQRTVLTTGATTGTLSPDGAHVVFELGFDLWKVPVKKGEGPNKDDAVQLTNWAGIDSNPVHTPDGKAVFFISDQNGPASLFRLNLESGQSERITTQEADVTNVQISPDNKYAYFQLFGKFGGIYRVLVTGGAPELVISRPGRANLEFSVAPDLRYITYVEEIVGSGHYYWDNGNSVIVYDTVTKTKTDITQLNVTHRRPVFSPDGKFVFFGSDRQGGGIFAVSLVQDDTRPGELPAKFEKPTQPVKIAIEADGIESRIRRVISGAATMMEIDREDGTLYYSLPDGIYRADYSGENGRKITGTVDYWEISSDQKTLLVAQGGNLNSINLKQPGFNVTNIAFRCDLVKDLTKTREAAYAQFWRAYNDGFYDPNFHGRDWRAIGEKYKKFLPSIGHNEEMATLLSLLTGELETSHAEVNSPPVKTRAEPTAHLGVTFDYAHTGQGLKVKDVPKRSPASYNKSKLSPGDVITKVNGNSVALNEALYRDVLNEQVGRNLVLNVTGADGKERVVNLRAISTGEFSSIVSSNLFESTRKMVEEKSKGTLTYVNIPAMSGGALTEFQQQLWKYARDKKGVIIDVRFNSGGNTADQIIDILERKQNMNYYPRDEQVIVGPGQVLDMPIVVLISEQSYSNGEMFPDAMRTLKMATLIGKRTPGYVIYTYGLPLVDGTIGRMPSTGVYRVDGSNMENNGVKPDIEVDRNFVDWTSGLDKQVEAAIEFLMKKSGKQTK